MLELAAKPYSWWFESHASPRRSVWLQSQISELDEKTKAMLKVIEEDADSFAQRAEMYYKRRPELVTMIGDFYRMHRSVAERFDQLKSEARIRLITPFCSSFQTQKLMNQMEKKPFDNSYSQNYDLGDGGQSEVDDPEQEEESRVNRGMEAEDCDESEVDDPKTEEKTNVDEDFGESEVDDPEHEEEAQVDQEGEVSSLNSERRVMKLRQEIEKLKEENRIQKGQLMGEYSSLILEIEAVKLRDEIERLKDENTTLREKLVGEFSCLIYKGEVEKLRNEIVILKNEHRIQKEQLMGKLSRGMMIQESEVAKLRDEIERLKEENRIQKEELLSEFSGLIHESEVAKLRDEIERLGKENRRIQKEQQLLGESFPTLIGDSEEVTKLKEELERAKEENRVQKEQLCQKDEEKREVIRQLSFSLDILKENLSPSKKKKGVVNESTKKWTPFEFNKLKGLVSAKLFGGYSKPSQSNPVVPLQTMI